MPRRLQPVGLPAPERPLRSKSTRGRASAERAGRANILVAIAIQDTGRKEAYIWRLPLGRGRQDGSSGRQPGPKRWRTPTRYQRCPRSRSARSAARGWSATIRSLLRALHPGDSVRRRRIKRPGTVREYVTMLHSLGDVQVIPRRSGRCAWPESGSLGCPRANAASRPVRVASLAGQPRIVKKVDDGPLWRSHSVIVQARPEQWRLPGSAGQRRVARRCPALATAEASNSAAKTRPVTT